MRVRPASRRRRPASGARLLRVVHKLTYGPQDRPSGARRPGRTRRATASAEALRRPAVLSIAIPAGGGCDRGELPYLLAGRASTVLLVPHSGS